MKEGKIIIRGLAETRQVWINNIELLPQPSQALSNHSTSGFCWGYGGSGPAQLALAICLWLFEDPDLTLAIYQDFKWKYVSAWNIDSDFQCQLDMEALKAWALALGDKRAKPWNNLRKQTQLKEGALNDR